MATATQIILATLRYIRKMRRGDRLPQTQKVVFDGNSAMLICTFSEYVATITIVTVDFNSAVCNDSDEDILKEVSNLCHNKVKCEFELTDLTKDHNSTCSSNESTAQLGITYHCSC